MCRKTQHERKFTTYFPENYEISQEHKTKDVNVKFTKILQPLQTVTCIGNQLL